VSRAEHPALLKKVKAGDKIEFDAENINGQYIVTKIERKHSGNFCAARTSAAPVTLTDAKDRKSPSAASLPRTCASMTNASDLVHRHLVRRPGDWGGWK
jgi:hypothetical protein